jgi:hypothetical protein
MMQYRRTVGATVVAAAIAGLAACGPGGERVDESYRQETIAPADAGTGTAGTAVGTGTMDTTVSGQTPTVDRPRLPHGDDTMGAGAGTSVVPPGGNP